MTAWLIDELNSARKEEGKARAKTRFQQMDADAFQELTRNVEKQVSKAMIHID